MPACLHAPAPPPSAADAALPIAPPTCHLHSRLHPAGGGGAACRHRGRGGVQACGVQACKHAGGKWHAGGRTPHCLLPHMQATCLHACTRACMPLRPFHRPRTPRSLLPHLHATSTSIPSCMPACLHACMPASLHACMPLHRLTGMTA